MFAQLIETSFPMQDKKLKILNLGTGAAIFTLDTFDTDLTDKYITCQLKIRADDGYGLMVSTFCYLHSYNDPGVIVYQYYVIPVHYQYNFNYLCTCKS